MFFKKITVYTQYNPLDEKYLSLQSQRQIVNIFTMMAFPHTKIKKLLLIAEKRCGFSDSDKERRDRFRLVWGKELLSLNEDARLCNLMAFFNIQDNKVTLEPVIGIGGGKGIAEIDGVRFFYHSREGIKHFPHIHARYQNKEMSIIFIPEQDMPRSKGNFKNKQKEKLAIEFAKKYRNELIENYKKFQNGIQIEPFLVDDTGLVCEE